VSLAAELPEALEASGREQRLNELGVAFKGALAAIRRLRGRETHRHGELSFAQYHLLFGLAEHGELPAGELALAAELSAATATQMLDSLTAMGLVERSRSERDRRVVTCTLTAHGRELITHKRAHFEQRWQQALARFDAGELATAAAVIDQLRTLYEDLDADLTGRPAEQRQQGTAQPRSQQAAKRPR
jgi:DNA-binding MarR family transcriptional regulator